MRQVEVPYVQIKQRPWEWIIAAHITVALP